MATNRDDAAPDDWIGMEDYPTRGSVSSHDLAKQSLVTKSGYDGEERIHEIQDQWDTARENPGWAMKEALSPQRVGRHRKYLEQRNALIANGLGRGLQHHSLGMWLMISYSVVAILSWTVTCVLCYRPIGIPSYENQAPNYTRGQFHASAAWRRAASIGSSIITSVGIPVTSAICAKAAAVHSQRKSSTKRPSLTLRQTLALADKGWSDLVVLRDMLRPSTSRRVRSWLLVVSTLLVGMALLIAILQSAYVTTIHIKVLTSEDEMINLGPQTSPGNMAAMKQLSILTNVASAIEEGSLSDRLPYLWSTSGVNNVNITSLAANLESPGQSNPNISDLGNLPARLFTATYAVGTDTGGLREIALRLNSSISCQTASQTDFPSSCPGSNPFSHTFTNSDSFKSNPFTYHDVSEYQIRICAPGDSATTPWNATGEIQTIHEEVWLDYQFNPHNDSAGTNFTQHCSSNSTLGYFELPNNLNDHKASDLLDAQRLNSSSFYEGAEVSPFGIIPAAEPGMGVPGPFMTSVLAIFGNGSFFEALTSYGNDSDINNNSSYILLCQQLRQTFSGLYDLDPTIDCQSDDSSISQNPFIDALLTWMLNFEDSNKSAEAFTLTIYYANNAILNLEETTDHWPLYSCAGYDIEKPTMPLPALILISVLLAMHLLGLAWLAQYAALHNTWTESLDSFALLRLGAAMAADFPVISSLRAEEAAILDQRAGWIGDAGGEGQKVRSLVMGGPERVKEEELYRLTTDDGQIHGTSPSESENLGKSLPS